MVIGWGPTSGHPVVVTSRDAASLAVDYREQVARPYLAAEAGIVDDVILPEETRSRMADALLLLSHEADLEGSAAHV